MISTSLLSLVSLASCAVARRTWFSFGDSYTQTGFNLTTGPLPSSENPLGNPAYPGDTVTGGEVWVEYVTTKYNTTEVFTYNFAYGGAVVDAELVTPYIPTVFTLTDQIDSLFLPHVDDIPEWTCEDSLFSIWIGINDVGSSFFLPGDRDEFSDVVLDAYFALVEKLYAVGARNFLFVNVPPINRSPLMLVQSEEYRVLAHSMLKGYNAKLAERITALEFSHGDVKTWTWDSYTSFTKIMDDPTAYGFKDATTYGNGTDLFWGDDYHPSSYVHKYLGEDVADVLAGFL